MTPLSCFQAPSHFSEPTKKTYISLCSKQINVKLNNSQASLARTNNYMQTKKLWFDLSQIL